MIAIIDYGVGNLFSLASSLKSLGLETKVKKSRCWASAWACSCCLKKAMSTASTPALA